MPDENPTKPSTTHSPAKPSATHRASRAVRIVNNDRDPAPSHGVTPEQIEAARKAASDAAETEHRERIAWEKHTEWLAKEERNNPLRAQNKSRERR